MTRGVWCLAGMALLVGTVAVAQEQALPPVGPDAGKALVSFVGDASDVAVARLARLLSPQEALSAIYLGTRAERLAALESMAVAPDPRFALPFLVSLLSSQDRAVASRAAHGLSAYGATCLEASLSCPEMPEGQRGQLASELERVARSSFLEPDVRVVALSSLALLEATPAKLVADLLTDEEPAVRRAALATIDVPVVSEVVLALAERAEHDVDLHLRGQAASLLCENALAHGAKAPSPDLAELLLEVLGSIDIPADALAGVVFCVHRFDAETHAPFAEKAQAHPDQRLGRTWRGLASR